TFGLPPETITAVSDAPFAQGSVSIAGPEPGAVGGRFEVRHHAHPDAQSFQNDAVRFKQLGLVTTGRLPWMLIPSIPALVHPLVLPSAAAAKRPGQGCRRGCAGWMITPLNQTFLNQHFFPELVARHFSGLDYEVAVVAGQKGDHHVIYSSDPKASEKSIA